MDFIVIFLSIKLQEVGAWSLVGEFVEPLVVMDTLGQRELDATVVELFHLRPAARCGLDYFHFDDLKIKLD